MSVGASILLAIATTALGVPATWFFAWLYFRLHFPRTVSLMRLGA